MFTWLLACATTPGTIGPGETPGSDTGVDSAEPLPGDTADTGSDDTADTADTGGGNDHPYGCSAIYDQDRLPAFDLEISDGEWASLRSDYASGRKEYHEAELHYEAEIVPVMVRLKGNPGFSWFGDKLQFVVSFNEVDPDARFHGLRKIAFDASWYDSTVLRDRLSWSVMRARGDLAAACANNSTLSINGEFYGVYGNIEYFDHEYLERVFGKESAGGTLWKYGAEPTANDDVADYGPINSLWAASTVEQYAALGDLQEWTRAWAAETVLGDDDGYVCCGHNFYVYDHPTEGLLFVPWDFDDTLDIAPFDADPVSGYAAGFFNQTAFVTLLRDPTWHAAYVDEVEAMNTAFDPDVVVPELDAWNAQIEDAVTADLYHTWGLEERRQTIERLRAWIPARHAFLDDWVACERGAPVDADGDGLDSCDDKDDSTPLAAETCNGRDDDNDGDIDEAAGCDDCVRHDLDDDHLLFCYDARTWADAQANCEDRGGTLASIPDTESYYMAFFWSWPEQEHWWLGDDGEGSCRTWNEASWNFGSATCTESHRSICELP